MAINQATLELLVQLKDNASAGLSSLGSSLGNVGMIAGGAALAGVVALGAAIVGGAKDALDARALYAQTESIIASTGNAAGVTAQQVVDLSAALSDAAGKSLFGDDQIQAAENVILKFKEIKVPLQDVTQLSIDMAQSLGTDPANAAKTLGLALQSPFDAAGKLAKQGIILNETQLAVLDTMKESGDVAGAQAVLVDALNDSYAGQAQAAAKAAGGMVQFQAGLGETFETIGAELLPILDELGAWLASPEVQAALSTFATNLANGIRIAADFIVHTLIPAIRDLYNWLAPILGPILAEIGRALSEDLPRGIDRVATGWANLKQGLSDFKTGYIDPIVRGWNAVSSGIETAWGWLQKIGNAVSSIAIPSWLQGHSPPPLANWMNDIAGAAESAGAAITTVAPPSGSMPTFAGAGAAGAASGGIVVNVTVQGNVTTERDLVRAVRDGLNQIGRQNLSIFAPEVTP
jgi:hypothetical protein